MTLVPNFSVDLVSRSLVSKTQSYDRKIQVCIHQRKTGGCNFALYRPTQLARCRNCDIDPLSINLNTRLAMGGLWRLSERGTQDERPSLITAASKSLLRFQGFGEIGYVGTARRKKRVCHRWHTLRPTRSFPGSLGEVDDGHVLIFGSSGSTKQSMSIRT